MRLVIANPSNEGRLPLALMRFAWWEIRRAAGGTYDLRIDGTRLKVRSDAKGALAQLAFSTRGQPEYDDMMFVRRYLRSTDLFVDVGAHVGLYAVLAASIAQNVIAIEPHPETAERLRSNLKLNGLTNVELHVTAVGRNRGTVQLSVAYDDGNYVVPQADRDINTIAVREVRLDDLVSADPAIVKLDVEGYEIEVLAGAQRVLGQRPVWIAELLGSSQRYGHDDQDVRRCFERYGYRPYRYRAATNELIEDFTRADQRGLNRLFIADLGAVLTRLAETH